MDELIHPTREELASLLAALHYGQYSTREDEKNLRKNIERALCNFDIGLAEFVAPTAKCSSCVGTGEDFNEGDPCHACNGTGKAGVSAVGEICIEPDYWNRGHFYEGKRKILVATTNLEQFPIGTKFYAELPRGVKGLDE